MDKVALNIADLENDIKKSARELLGDKLLRVVLYGSFARGDFNNESDVDFALLSGIPVEEIPSFNEKLGDITSELSIKYGILVSLMIISMDTFIVYKNTLPFYINLVKEGIVVYG